MPAELPKQRNPVQLQPDIGNIIETTNDRELLWRLARENDQFSRMARERLEKLKDTPEAAPHPVGRFRWELVSLVDDVSEPRPLGLRRPTLSCDALLHTPSREIPDWVRFYPSWLGAAGALPDFSRPPWLGRAKKCQLPIFALQRSLSYSITSSALRSNDWGTSKPIALAVLRLTAVSYLVGTCTGSSAGFAPCRMRSTYDAAF